MSYNFLPSNLKWQWFIRMIFYMYFWSEIMFSNLPWCFSFNSVPRSCSSKTYTQAQGMCFSRYIWHASISNNICQSKTIWSTILVIRPVQAHTFLQGHKNTSFVDFYVYICKHLIWLHFMTTSRLLHNTIEVPPCYLSNKIKIPPHALWYVPLMHCIGIMLIITDIDLL